MFMSLTLPCQINELYSGGKKGNQLGFGFRQNQINFYFYKMSILLKSLLVCYLSPAVVK